MLRWVNSLCYWHHLGLFPVALSPLWIFKSSWFFIFFSCLLMAVCKIASSSIHNTWVFQTPSLLESSFVCRSAPYCFACCSYFCKAGKQKKKETKPNSRLFDSPPTSCVNLATWNFSDSPDFGCSFSQAFKIVARYLCWEVFRFYYQPGFCN